MKPKMLIGFFVLIFLAGTVNTVPAEPVSKFMDTILPFDNLETAGYFRNEVSSKMAGEKDELLKMKNVMGLKANYRVTDWLSFFTHMKFWYDALYDIEGSYHDVAFKENNDKLRMPLKQEWLRECFFDVYTPRLDARLGKQQVVWGTTDGVRILDMVNPLDYREWTLPPYSETRIPLWMLRLEGEIMMNGHLQLLVIPDYEPNYYPPAGAPYALRTTVVGANGISNLERLGVSVSTISEAPARKLENTKIGLRWRNIVESGPLSGLEYTLNYLHTYSFASSAYTLIKGFVIPGVGFVPNAFQLTRRAQQIEVFGASFNKSITKGIVGDFGKGWTLRGEFAYIKGDAMNIGTDKSIQDTVDVDQYKYALGFDKTFLTNLGFSFQFIQLISRSKDEYDVGQYTLLFGPTRGPLDEVETILTCKIFTDFMHERVQPEILVIYGDDNDWRISPKVSFVINDNWQVAGGFHFFEGKPQHLNGQFDKEDQVFLETQYTW